MKPVSCSELRSKYNICLGIARWKRTNFLQFVGGSANAKFRPLKDFHIAIEEARELSARIIVWASSTPSGLVDLAKEEGVQLFFVEDGFIRSAGLGITLNMPASLCFSRSGIHYDARYPSNLETYLQKKCFSSEDVASGEKLIRTLQDKRITKYNLTGDKKKIPWLTGKGKRILVVGQVSDDASLKYGSLVVRNNHELLASVRRIRPNDQILYRPHPDVTAGLRNGEVGAEDLFASGASSVSGGDLLTLIDQSYEVHVASSQTGLEACLRGASVVCHGQPFYSGWGFTTDINPVPRERRCRSLSLAEFMFVSYVEYPLYVNPFTGEESDVFEIIDLINSSCDWPRAPRSFIIGVWLNRRGISKRTIKQLFSLYSQENRA